ncbi:holin [Oenococcus sicerae]|uniref:holin n=1 Tax=Oenococcus sicerae TaxID=2203724 RepID=UPI0039E9B53E
MNVQNISDLIMAIAIAAVPAIGTWLVKILKANKFVAILAPLAHDAVVAAQKLGVVSYLEGEAKKSKALDFLKSALAKLGFKKADLTTLENAIEDEYQKSIAQLDVVYPQLTKAQAEAEDTAVVAKAKADALVQAQADLKNAQAKVTQLSN